MVEPWLNSMYLSMVEFSPRSVGSAFACNAANVDPITSTMATAMRLTKRLDRRASNRDFGLVSGRNLDSLKRRLGRAKPLNS